MGVPLRFASADKPQSSDKGVIGRCTTIASVKRLSRTRQMSADEDIPMYILVCTHGRARLLRSIAQPSMLRQANDPKIVGDIIDGGEIEARIVISMVIRPSIYAERAALARVQVVLANELSPACE